MAGAVERRPLRADAQRNYERILAAAEQAFAQQGASVSFEEIARRAKVGSATLHRRFSSRRELLEAVFHSRVEALCARAGEHAEASEPGAALVAWLGDLSEYATASRGLTAILLGGPDADLLEHDDGCTAKITATADELLTRAQHAGAVAPDVRAEDLLALVSAISLAAQERDGGLAARLLEIVIGGIRRCGAAPPVP
ncbi:TetR family transcriptional regulator [Streptomyces chartreusis]|uniref:TetR/AcrR family transcriptional regulator n=1 Tax=Streptomyces chartreusis TaxID=1969 RepID=UPI00368B5AA2